jgi:flagellar motor switch protein FliG
MRLITLVDIFQMERKDLQKLLWEAYRAKIALPVLFAMASAQGQEYLIKQLPDSISDILRREIQAVKPVAPGRADAEGRRLLQMARTMAKNGEIAPIQKKAA